jgi:serine acetyltransferase
MTITFKQTVSNMQADFSRRMHLESKQGFFSGLVVFFKRGMVAAFLYRLARYCALNDYRLFTLLIMKVSAAYSELEISPLAEIGPGMVLADTGGIGINHAATIGINCTFLGCSTLTLGAMDSLDEADAQIVIGDYCTMGHRAKIMRPVVLANGTQINANTVVMRSVVRVGSVLSGIPAKVNSVEEYDDIMRWNPLYGGFVRARH